MRAYTAPTHRKVLQRVYRVNNIPFRGLYPQNVEAIKNKEHQSRSPCRNGARRRHHSPDDWWDRIYLGKMVNGTIEGDPKEIVSEDELESEHARVNAVGLQEAEQDYRLAHIPFLNDARDEPVFQTAMPNGSRVNVYVDTGAQVDLFPMSMLNACFPGWRQKKTISHTKLKAANETVIAHEGRVRIVLPLPKEAEMKGIEMNPFIIHSTGDEDTMILGYETMKRYGLVPIPGSGLLCMGRNKDTPPLHKLHQFIKGQKGPTKRIRMTTSKHCAQEKTWTARPLTTTFVPAFQRADIILQPRGVAAHDMNSRNGSRTLVRECPCILTEECEACIRSERSVQACNLINGRLTYVVDNTHSGYSRTIGPKTDFFISFEPVFNMEHLAEEALASLPTREFEIELPRNPYTEEECEELFQKTREEVTASLRSIIAEPASWSLDGYQPETLKLINHQGIPCPPERERGPPMRLEDFARVNPCPTCAGDGDTGCHLERQECELRKLMRYKELPEEFVSTVNIHENHFEPHQARGGDLVVGCLRRINGHGATWNRWFPRGGSGPGATLLKQNLSDAAITEVSKGCLVQVGEEALAKKVKNIHFTNFAAYGVSRNLLQRCIPHLVNIHLYETTDSRVAGPGYDPRKYHPGKNNSAQPARTHGKLREDAVLHLEPGLPKRLSAQETGLLKGKPTIITEDDDLRKRCETMLESHKEVFAKTDTDCGQFQDPETKKPYYFKVRLKSNDPVTQKTRYVAPAKEQAATELISALMAGGIVKRKYTPYQNQSVYVAKKRKLLTKKEHLDRGGRLETYVEGMVDPRAPLKLRHCLDLAKTNVNILEDNMSTMSPKDLIRRLNGARSACSLDISNAFLALTLDSASENLTGFESGVHGIRGKLVYTRSSMGLQSSSKFLEIALAKTLTKAHGHYLRFADDIIIIGDSDEQVLERVSSILHLLKVHNWRVKKEKMTIFTKNLYVFGLHVDLDRQVVTAPRASLDAVLLRPKPASKDELRSWNGMVAWWGENLGHHFRHTATLQRMARKDTPFEWSESNLMAYEGLQEMFWKPLLHTSLPNYNLDFHLVSDSSEFGSGLVLLQIGPREDLRVIAYHSHIHDERTARLSPMERESYALMFGLASFFDIIGGHNTVCHTDSAGSVLITLMSKSNSKIARWSCLLHSLPWLKVSFMSSKAPLLKMADWLSRRPAGSREWKNKKATDEDLQKITLAAAKLKRDTVMTMRQHELIVDYICSLEDTELENIKDEAVYIDADGVIHHDTMEGEDEAKHAQPGGQREAPPGQQPSSQTYMNHPAFGTKETRKCLESDLPEGELRYTESKPKVQSNDTESELVQEDGEHIDKVWLTKIARNKRDTQQEEPPKEAGEAQAAMPQSNAEGRRGTEAGQGLRTRSGRRSKYQNKPSSSLFQLQPGVIQENSFNPAILPNNVLTFEEADGLGLLSPATQRPAGPRKPEGTWDRPPEAKEGDVEGKFLDMTFIKSPWMKLGTLIKSQRSDPKLEMLRKKCNNGPLKYGGATYLLKEGVLLRKHTKDGLETIQVCLSGASAYSLCLRAHVGDGTGTWRSPRSPSLHNGPRKLHNLIAARFYADNLAKMCTDISGSCYICAEGKENQAKTRPDAVRNMITPSVPAEAFSIDILSLPESGHAGGKLLTAQCIYSKFAIAIPIEREATTEYLFHLINWYIFSQHSRPRMILVDNARHLAGSAMREVTNQLNIELRTIPVYSARSNPVENLNGILVKQLRLYHLHHNVPYNQWKETMPFILNAVNHAAFEGELGQKYNLSPARIFYGGSRDTLNPTLRYDMPYLANRYKSHVDFVEKTANAAWVTQQIVCAHRQAQQAARAQRGQTENPRFAKAKDFKVGDVVLLDRNLAPGVISKLRPRSSYRFVVMDSTETVAYCRPFSAGSLQRWADAQKFTKQTKGNLALLPLLKLPKERLKLDKSLHLWTSNSRANEYKLFGNLAQPDPEPLEVTVDELHGSDWLEEEPVEPGEEGEDVGRLGEEDDRHCEEEGAEDPKEGGPMDPKEGGARIPPAIERLLRGPCKGPSEKATGPAKGALKGRKWQQESRCPKGAQGRKARAKRPGAKGSDDPPPYTKVPAKRCTFDGVIKYNDGSTAEIKDLPRKCNRVFKCLPHEDDAMQHYDDKYCGRHVPVPAKHGSDKYAHIPPGAMYNRTCACRPCAKQLSRCRVSPCGECKPI